MLRVKFLFCDSPKMITQICIYDLTLENNNAVLHGGDLCLPLHTPLNPLLHIFLLVISLSSRTGFWRANDIGDATTRFAIAALLLLLLPTLMSETHFLRTSVILPQAKSPASIVESTLTTDLERSGVHMRDNWIEIIVRLYFIDPTW